jgi:hypothetical protein
LSEQTRQAIDDYLRTTNKRSGQFLFTGRHGLNRNMTTRQYARLVAEWIGSVGLTRGCSAPLITTDKSDADLSADGQSQGRPASARAYQDREHGPLSRHDALAIRNKLVSEIPGQSGHALPNL